MRQVPISSILISIVLNFSDKKTVKVAKGRKGDNNVYGSGQIYGGRSNSRNGGRSNGRDYDYGRDLPGIWFIQGSYNRENPE